jgi:hypothetical protein
MKKATQLNNDDGNSFYDPQNIGTGNNDKASDWKSRYITRSFQRTFLQPEGPIGTAAERTLNSRSFISLGVEPLQRPRTTSTPGAVPISGIGTRNYQIELSSDEDIDNEATSTPLFDASLVEENEKSVVYAEQINRELWTRMKRRRASFVIFLLFAIACFAAGLTMLFGENNKGSSSQTTKIEYVGSTLAPILTTFPPAPTSAPTDFYVYDLPSVQECTSIASGQFLYGQEGWIVSEFKMKFDIIIESSNPSLEYLDDLDEKLQTFMAPALAGCTDTRRSLLRNSSQLKAQGSRNLRRDYVVGNAYFDVETPRGQSCIVGSPESCHRVDVNLELYLKGDESTLKLIGLIMDIFGQVPLVPRLDLTSPFQTINLMGVNSNMVENENSRYDDDDADDADAPDDDNDDDSQDFRT